MLCTYGSLLYVRYYMYNLYVMQVSLFIIFTWLNLLLYYSNSFVSCLWMLAPVSVAVSASVLVVVLVVCFPIYDYCIYCYDRDLLI